MTYQEIEINRLSKSPSNARRTVAKGAADDLKASILAHGLMQNLVVSAADGGGFHVIEGARRLEALKALQADGKLPADYAAPCQVVTGDDALEKSLAANTVRLAMHPADEYEAFAKLAAAGASPEVIAERFGKPVKVVQQRLRLGNADPKLLKAYRAGQINLECLTAFCLTDDKPRQLKAFNRLKSQHALHPNAIRRALTESMAEADGKLALFVGLDAYREAGGTTQSDLFSDAVYLENPELLSELAAAKLNAARKELEAEGWGWVAASLECDYTLLHSCGRLQPQPVAMPPELAERHERLLIELREIDQALEDTESDALIDAQDEANAQLCELERMRRALAAFDPYQMTFAGCYVSVSHDGTIHVNRGLVRKADMKRLASPGAAAERKPKGMPQTLKRQLEAYRLQAAQLAIAGNRLLALDLLIFTVARSIFAGTVLTGPQVRFTINRAVVESATPASEAMKALRRALPLDWLDQPSEAEQFRVFTNLSESQRLDLLAFCVASCLQPQLATGKEATAYEAALSLTGADMAAYWRPTAANYLKRIPRDQLLSLGREMLGGAWADASSREKKSQLAAELERAFAAPASHGRTPQRAERLSHWLPEGMGFTALEADKPKSKGKNRKAA